MLLSEFLKAHHAVQDLKAVVAQQQKQIEALTAGLFSRTSLLTFCNQRLCFFKFPSQSGFKRLAVFILITLEFGLVPLLRSSSGRSKSTPTSMRLLRPSKALASNPTKKAPQAIAAAKTQVANAIAGCDWRS